MEYKYGIFIVHKASEIRIYSLQMISELCKGECFMEDANNTKERDGTMAALSKPVNGAFVLSNRKAKDFLDKKVCTSSDAIRRFEKLNKNAEQVASRKNK